MIDALREQFNRLYYFDDNLKGNTDRWLAAKDNEILTTQLLHEMVFVNKLRTIGMYYEWLVQHEDDSLFNQSIFKSRITQKNPITDPFGYIDKWGMAMTPEEFEAYQQFYDELFETSKIDESAELTVSDTKPQ